MDMEKKPALLNNPERRESILNTAAYLFAEKGFDAVSTKELAAEVGCSQALLFRYFPTKDALYETLFQEMYDLDMLPVVLPPLPGETGLQWLWRFHNTWGHYKDDLGRPFLRDAVYSRVSYRERLGEAARKAPDLVENTIIPIFQRGQLDHSLPVKDCGKGAAIYWAMVIGTQVISSNSATQSYSVPNFDDIVRAACTA